MNNSTGSNRMWLALEIIVFMFILCALILWPGCQCKTLSPVTPGPAAPIWDWVEGPQTTLRCYPKHTDAGSPNTDNASLSAYVWKQFTDGPESTYYQGEEQYNLYLSEFEIDSTGGGTNSSPQVFSETAAYWGCCYMPGYLPIINWYPSYCKIQWDFSPLPVAAIVDSSFLHTQTYADHTLTNPEKYYAYGSSLGSIAISPQDMEEKVTANWNAGTSWVGGSQPWLEWWNNGAHPNMAAEILGSNTYAPTNANRRDCTTSITLGWGSQAAGDCTYIDVTYHIMEWRCTQNCL